MERFIVIEYAPCYDTLICGARRLTDEEKQHYRPEFAEKGFIGLGDDITVKHIELSDLPKRKADGSFLGCNNFAFIISEKEKEAFIALNAKREKEKTKKELVQSIENLKYSIGIAEIQRKNHNGILPDRETARKRMGWQNNLYNEGGEGYIEHEYCQEEYDSMTKSLADYEARLKELA